MIVCMARYSIAYSGLIRRLDEVDSMRVMAQDIAKAGPIPMNIMRVNALCRGGIVLLCSHIEGYVENLGALAITRLAENDVPKASLSVAFRYHLSRDLIDNIKSTSDPESIAQRVDTLLTRDGHIWDSGSNFTPPLPTETFLGNFATPRHENIRRFFGRFGYVSFSHELAVQLKQNFQACVTMVDHVVDQRNKIAHGDFVTAGVPSDLENMCNFVRMYCRTTDQIVGNWFRKVGCPIR